MRIDIYIPTSTCVHKWRGVQTDPGVERVGPRPLSPHIGALGNVASGVSAMPSERLRDHVEDNEPLSFLIVD